MKAAEGLISYILLNYSGDRQESRRHASVLVLAQLARHASVIVYPYVGTILNHIWGAMREPKVGYLAYRDHKV